MNENLQNKINIKSKNSIIILSSFAFYAFALSQLFSLYSYFIGYDYYFYSIHSYGFFKFFLMQEGLLILSGFINFFLKLFWSVLIIAYITFLNQKINAKNFLGIIFLLLPLHHLIASISKIIFLLACYMSIGEIFSPLKLNVLFAILIFLPVWTSSIVAFLGFKNRVIYVSSLLVLGGINIYFCITSTIGNGSHLLKYINTVSFDSLEHYTKVAICISNFICNMFGYIGLFLILAAMFIFVTKNIHLISKKSHPQNDYNTNLNT